MDSYFAGSICKEGIDQLDEWRVEFKVDELLDEAVVPDLVECPLYVKKDGERAPTQVGISGGIGVEF